MLQVARLTAAAGRRCCMPRQVCLHDSGERGSQTVSGAEAGLFTAARGLFESVTGSLLAPAARHLTPVVGKS